MVSNTLMPVQDLYPFERSGMIRTTLMIILFVAVGWISALGQEATADTDTTYSPVKKIDEMVYEIGNITLDRRVNKMTIPGWVNMDRGPIEYFAVTPEGKTHESVLVLDIQPLHLQIALLLCGFDQNQNLECQGDSALPQGDSVEAFVEWTGTGGETVICPAADLVYDYVNKISMTCNWWVFTGSFIWDNRLAADTEGSIIATYSDPVAILNTPSWGRADDTVYGVNEEKAPPPGTPIRLIIKTGDRETQKGDSK